MQLEKGAFEKRTADFLWMMIFGAISLLVSASLYCIFSSLIRPQKFNSLDSHTTYKSFLLGSGIVSYSLPGYLFLGSTHGQHASLCLEQRISEFSDQHVWPCPTEGKLHYYHI